MNPDDIFVHLQEILNTSENIIISKGIEIIWAVKVSPYDVMGFVKIGDRILSFGATFYPDENKLDITIGKKILFSLSLESIIKVVDGEKE